MGEDQSKAKQIAGYSFLVAFANDGVIDTGELEMMKRLALSDGKVDADECRVLEAIFSRVDPEKTKPEVMEEIQRFRKHCDV